MLIAPPFAWLAAGGDCWAHACRGAATAARRSTVAVAVMSPRAEDRVIRVTMRVLVGEFGIEVWNAERQTGNALFGSVRDLNGESGKAEAGRGESARG